MSSGGLAPAALVPSIETCNRKHVSRTEMTLLQTCNRKYVAELGCRLETSWLLPTGVAALVSGTTEG
eukprot:scaffold6818_cov60-Phaeocystis_antarctica.AAC.3